MSHKTLLYYARYHEWATGRILAAVYELTPEQQNADCKLFFRSIRGTLNHLYLAENLWYNRLCGTSTAGVETYWGKPAEAWEAYATVTHISPLLIKQTKLWQPLITTIANEKANNGTDDDAFLAYKSTYKNTKGGDEVNQFAACVMQVFNHGTHHRGQIHAALTQLGVEDPVGLDMQMMKKQIRKNQPNPFEIK